MDKTYGIVVDERHRWDQVDVVVLESSSKPREPFDY